MSNHNKEEDVSEVAAVKEKTDIIKNEREKALREFIALMGAKSAGQSPSGKKPAVGKLHEICSMRSNSNAAEIQKYLDPNSQMGIGAVCSFPSLDLGDKELPLPSVGSSSSKQAATASKGVPSMRASILALTGLTKSSNLAKAGEQDQASASTSSSVSDMQQASENAAVLEQAAATNLVSPTTWTRPTVHLASLTMLRSFAQSYVSLVASRVKAWTLLLLRKSLSSGDKSSRSGLLKLLATTHSLHLSSVSTSFLCLPHPVVPQADQQDEDEGEFVLPLLFEAAMTISIQDEDLPVKLRCPGVVLGKFSPKTTLLSLVKINLDANSLVSCMVEQARLAVFKAVAIATSFNVCSASPVSTLSQFHTALNLSKSTQKHPINTAASSTQSSSSNDHSQSKHSKIPSAVTAPNLNIDKIRKNRSVTWDHQIDRRNTDNGSNAKRSKSSQSAVLKSSRSFGKPDSSTFETNRNATFGEFGRSPMHLFVNGKLTKASVNSMDYKFGLNSVNNSSTSSSASKGNAVFSAASRSLSQMLLKPTITDAHPLKKQNNPKSKPTLFAFASDLAINRKKQHQLGRNLSVSDNTNLNTQMQIPQPSLPRTPTALEGFLLAKAISNNTVARNDIIPKQSSLKRTLPPELASKSRRFRSK